MFIYGTFASVHADGKPVSQAQDWALNHGTKNEHVVADGILQALTGDVSQHHHPPDKVDIST